MNKLNTKMYIWCLENHEQIKYRNVHLVSGSQKEVKYRNGYLVSGRHEQVKYRNVHLLSRAPE
jgi:hypothetical protein